MSAGSGADAAYVTAGGQPNAIATGSRSPSRSASAACEVESLWICQCRPTVRSSCICRRYMPRLRAPVCGCLVWVSPRLRNTPPSSGQALMPGSIERSTSSSL